MLFLAVAWILLAGVSVPIGTTFLQWTDATAFDRLGDRIVLSIWLGVLVLGSGLLAVSLAVPLRPIVGAALAVAASASALMSAPVRDEVRSLISLINPARAACLAACVSGVGLFTAQPVVWTDTGLYHAGVIRWLSQYGTVDGIGLVHFRLGFTSSWFALAAPFNAGGLRARATAVMGGFGLFLLTLQTLICLSRVLEAMGRRADWLFISGATLLMPVFVWHAVPISANPDVPLAILVLVTGWTIVVLNTVTAESLVRTSVNPGPLVIPVVLASGAMTVKLSAAPLLAVGAVFFALKGGRSAARLATGYGLTVALLAPWLAVQSLTTGCPLFPVPVCFDLPWSVGTNVARDASNGIMSWAQSRGATPAGGLAWFPDWIRRDVTTPVLASALVSVALAGAGLAAGRRAILYRRVSRLGLWLVLVGVAGVFRFMLKADDLLMLCLVALSVLSFAITRAEGWLLASGLLGTALILYSGPDPRFALGYMALLLGRLVLVHGQALWRWLRQGVALGARVPTLGLPVLLVVAGIALAVGRAVRPTTTRQDVVSRPGLLIPPKTEATGIKIRRVDGISYRLPSNGLCWSAELPCTQARYVDSDVVLRHPGEGIGGGFMRKAGTLAHPRWHASSPEVVPHVHGMAGLIRPIPLSCDWVDAPRCRWPVRVVPTVVQFR